MLTDSPTRIAIALLLLVGGVAVGVALPGSFAPVAVVTVTTLLAAVALLATSADNAPAKPAPAAAAERDHTTATRLRNDAIAAFSDPVLLVDGARVVFANDSALKLLGDHIVGEDVRIAIRHPAAADRLANPEVQHAGDPILLVGIGGADQRWELRTANLPDGSKLVRLADQSSHHAAERMRTDFVANASHELRTPLAAVKGFIETLQDPKAGKDDDTRARFLKIMYDETERMRRLIDDLMSLSRIEAEKHRLPDEPVDLTALVKEVRAFFVDSRGKKASQFRLDIADPLPPVRGDASQLSQLLHNLVANAFKYGRRNAPVTVSAGSSRGGSMVQLTVADEGEGIDPRHIPRLTERFYRIDRGRSQAIGGTGLGLAIVKHIVERHGGRMEITSEAGVGTRVAIHLPAIRAERTARRRRATM